VIEGKQCVRESRESRENRENREKQDTCAVEKAREDGCVYGK